MREALLRLPFVKSSDGRIDSMWSVQGTCDYAADCKLGRAHARACLEYMKKDKSPIILGHILREMSTAAAAAGSRGIEIGFCHAISVAAIGGRSERLVVGDAVGPLEPGDDLSRPARAGNLKVMAAEMSGGPPVFLSTKEVCRRVSFTKRHIDRLIAAGAFPSKTRLGHRTVVWRASEVLQWQLDKERVGRPGNSTEEAEP